MENFVGSKTRFIGPRAVSVFGVEDSSDDLVGLVLVGADGMVVGVAPSRGWDDFDVIEGFLGGQFGFLA